MKAIAVLLLGLAGCAHLPPECRTEYAHTLPQCPKPRPRQPCDCVEWCEITGPERRCYLVPRDEIRRMMRGY